MNNSLPDRTKNALLAMVILLVALLPRLPGLDIFLTADEPKSWFGRSIQFLDALARADWAATFDSTAPGVTTMWAGSLGLLLEYARQGFPGSLTAFLANVPFDPLDPAILPLIRLPGVLVAALAAVLTYLWGRHAMGRTAALLTALLLALDPFLLALTRILGHDGLVTVFMWLSLLAFLRAIPKNEQLAMSNEQTLSTQETPKTQNSHSPGRTTPEKPKIQNSKLKTQNSHSPDRTAPGKLKTQNSLYLPLDRRFIIISGAIGGLAFLTKTPSLFLGTFIALVMLVFHWRRRQTWPKMVRNWVVDVAVWTIAAGIIFTLLWPAMWVDPVGRVVTIINDALRASGSPHQKGSFFFGQPVPDPGASYYLIVTLFKTTPVLWLGWLLALTGLIVGRRRGHARSLWYQTALILLAFGLLFGLLVTVGGKKQDRYILPSFPTLVALAALGYTKIQLVMSAPRCAAAFKWAQGENGGTPPKPPGLRRFLSSNEQPAANSKSKIPKGRFVQNWILIPLIVVIQAAFVLPYYPYYFTFYTPLLGGGNNAAQTMIIGWGEGLDRAANWLNKQDDAQNLDVVAWYSTTFEPFFKGNAIYKIEEEKISRTPKPGLAADYVVFYVNQVQRELPSSGALQFFQAVPPAHTVTLRGVDYAWIYPSVKMQHVFSNEARLVGQAELLGYTLLDMQGRPISELPADSIATIQLYWEWQGKAPDELIGLNLVDADGYVWGRGNPLGSNSPIAFENWAEGAIVHDDFTLEILPGAPPGHYYLKAWIDRPATGERVGDFPLRLEDTQILITRPASPPSPSDLPLSERLDLPLADGIKLIGFDNGEQMAQPWPPGESRDFSLYWQATQSITENHPITLALVDSQDVIRASWVGLPAGGHFPTDQWQPGDIIRDPWALTLPPYVPPGDYRLTVKLGAESPVDLLTAPVEGRPRLFDPPPLDLALNTTFGQSIKLLGLQAPTANPSTIEIRPGQLLTLNLVWHATDLVNVDYTVTVQLLDSRQQVRAQHDSMPLNGTAPTTSWAAGEVIPDSITLDIPAEVGPAPHQLLLALYRVETGERLLLPNGADHLTIPANMVIGN